MAESFDHFDRLLLAELQRDAGQSQRDLAERVGLSQNAVWRRIRALHDRGVIRNTAARLDRDKAGLPLVVFAMLRTRSHSADWLKRFRAHVQSIPEITGVYRIAGDYDYLLQVTTADIASYDRIYQRLIKDMELENVTSYFAMEAIAEDRPLVV